MKNILNFIGNTTSYTWKKYSLGTDPSYTWNKYEATPVTRYSWKTYQATPTATSFTWNRYQKQEVPRYANFENVDPRQGNYEYTWGRWTKFQIIDPGDSYYEWYRYEPAYEWGKYTGHVTSTPVYQWVVENPSYDKTSYKSYLVKANSQPYRIQGEKYYSSIGFNNPVLDINYFNLNDYFYAMDCSESELEVRLNQFLEGRANDGNYSSPSSITYSSTGDIDCTFERVGPYILENGNTATEAPANQVYYSVYYVRLMDNLSLPVRKKTSNKNFIIGTATMQAANQKLTDTAIPACYTFAIDGNTWEYDEDYNDYFLTDYRSMTAPITIVVKHTPGSSNVSLYISNVDVYYAQKQPTGSYEVETDNYVETVTSSDPNAYPDRGFINGFVYIKFGGVVPGAYLDTYRGTTANQYPSGQVYSDGYYYTYGGEKVATETYCPGFDSAQWTNPTNTVTSTSPGTYPANGYEVTGYYYYYYQGGSFKSEYDKDKTYEYLPNKYCMPFLGTTNYDTYSASIYPAGGLDYVVAYMYVNCPNVDLSKNERVQTYVYRSGSAAMTDSDFADWVNTNIANGYMYLTFKASDTSSLAASDIYNIAGSQSEEHPGGYNISGDGQETVVIYLPKPLDRYGFEFDASSVSLSMWIRGQLLFVRNTNVAPSYDKLPGNFLGFSSQQNDAYWQYEFTTYAAGAFIDTVTSTSISAYPQDGVSGDYYYILANQEVMEWEKGNLIGEIYSYTKDYPEDGVQNSVWYVMEPVETKYIYSTLVEIVYAKDEDAYPDDGYQNGYYYIKQTAGPNYPQQFIEFVQATNTYIYPDNGERDGCWYVRCEDMPTIEVSLDQDDIISTVDYQYEINSNGDLTIGNTASAEISLTALLNETTLGLIGKRCIAYAIQNDTFEPTCLGYFTITSVEKQNDHVVKLKGYDALDNFSNSASAFLSSVKFPITLKNFFAQVCTQFGATAKTDFINGDILIQQLNITESQITGLTLLSYIAEAVAGFVIVNQNNEIEIRTYAEANINITPSTAVSILQSEFTTPTITKLIVRTDTGEYVYGSGDVAYLIDGNPIFDDDSNREILAPYILDTLLNYSSYVPAEIELLRDYDIGCGNVVMVNNKPTLIMKKELDSSGVKIKSYGNSVREQVLEQGSSSSSIPGGGYTGSFSRSSSNLTSEITNNNTGASTRFAQSSTSVTIDAGSANLQITPRSVSASYGDNALTVNQNGVLVAGDLSVQGANTSSIVIRSVEDGIWIGNSGQTTGLLFNMETGVLYRYLNGNIQ